MLALTEVTFSQEGGLSAFYIQKKSPNALMLASVESRRSLFVAPHHGYVSPQGPQSGPYVISLGTPGRT